MGPYPLRKAKEFETQSESITELDHINNILPERCLMQPLQLATCIESKRNIAREKFCDETRTN